MPETKSPLKINLKIYLQGILLFLIVAVIVYFIVNNLSKSAQILLVLIGFGGVILVHEFGHFIVAKLSDIKVEAFSIGFPPILLGTRRTEKGFHFRILPQFFPKHDDETGDGLLSFTIPKETKSGETEYRIGLIPFGGFVAMLGQHDIGPTEKIDDPRAFINKPIGTRMAVIAAGVAMNLITAVMLFIILFMIGIERTPAVVGDVFIGAPAHRAGIHAGDKIIQVKGRKNPSMAQVDIAAGLAGQDEKIPLTVQHHDGSVENIHLIAETLPGTKLKSFGILPERTLTIAKLIGKDNILLKEKTGLLPKDQVTAVNGQNVNAHWQLKEIVKSTLAPTVTFSAKRTISKTEQTEETQLIQTTIPLELIATHAIEPKSESNLSHICSMVPRLCITGFYPPVTLKDKIIKWLYKLGIVKQELTKPDLRPGDIIIQAGQVSLPTYAELRKVTTKHKGQQLPFRLLRENHDGNQQLLSVTVTPKQDPQSNRVMVGITLRLDAEHPVVAKTTENTEGLDPLPIPRGATVSKVNGKTVTNFYEIINIIRQSLGQKIDIEYITKEQTTTVASLEIPTNNDFINVKSIFAEPVPFEPLTKLYKAAGPFSAIKMGYDTTTMRIAETYLTIRRLIEGGLSPDSLMGPVGIFAFSYRVVSEAGITYYVFFLAWISVILAVLNFLPLPVIDGGYIIILLLEKIKGSPISRRAQEIWSYTGLVLLGTLFLYVTGNDILRLLLE